MNVISEDGQLLIEIVVRHVHPPSGLRIGQSWRPLHGARESVIRRIKGRFPKLGEFVEDVGYSSLIGFIVDEDDSTLITGDKFA